MAFYIVRKTQVHFSPKGRGIKQELQRATPAMAEQNLGWGATRSRKAYSVQGLPPRLYKPPNRLGHSVGRKGASAAIILVRLGVHSLYFACPTNSQKFV